MTKIKIIFLLDEVRRVVKRRGGGLDDEAEHYLGHSATFLERYAEGNISRVHNSFHQGHKKS